MKSGFFLKTLVFLISLLVSSNLIFAQKYVGVAKCKMCHNKVATGQQFKKWSEDKHSQALKSLSSKESLEYAKKNNIADPTKEAKCLKCHSTYASVDAKLRDGITAIEGVSCESCHGGGSVYKDAKMMKDHALAMKNGLIMPDQNVCEKCHNTENPFHKPFDYKTFAAKIDHKNPSKKK
jgi:hypothetical protein